MNHRNSCGQHSHRSTRRSRSRFLNVGAGYRCTCSTNLWNKNANRSPWYCIHRCGKTPSGCADWRNRCSNSHNSGCGKHSHSWKHHNFGNSFPGDAGCWNILPKSRSCNYGRWNRSSQISFGRKRTNSFCTRCWCKLRPVHFGESMYDCRNPGKCRSRSPQHRDFWSYMSLNIGRNDSYCIHYSWHDHETNVRLQRMCPGTNTIRMKGSCQ